MSTERCQICGFPLAESADKGCVPGNCSYRPDEGSPEWNRIQQRKEQLRHASPAAQAQETPARRAALADLDKVCEELVAAEQGEPAPPVEPMGAEQAIRDAVHAEHAKENLRLLNENASLRAEIERLRQDLSFALCRERRLEQRCAEIERLKSDRDELRKIQRREEKGEVWHKEKK